LGGAGAPGLRGPVRREDDQRDSPEVRFDHGGQEVGSRRAGRAEERHRPPQSLGQAQAEKARRPLVDVAEEADFGPLGKEEREGRRAGARRKAHLPQAGANQLVDKGDGGKVRVHRGDRSSAWITGLILSADSSNSASGSESATIPHPANRCASSPASRAERKATAKSPPPGPIQPTGPAYQPRSIPSTARMSSRAAPVGCPPTAGVGCSRSTRSRMERGAASLPRTGVKRCCTLRTLRSEGAGATSRL